MLEFQGQLMEKVTEVNNIKTKLTETQQHIAHTHTQTHTNTRKHTHTHRDRHLNTFMHTCKHPGTHILAAQPPS